jgi:hypothetical protein
MFESLKNGGIEERRKVSAEIVVSTSMLKFAHCQCHNHIERGMVKK